jgi:predicted protein tyrosine phosphatase
VNFDLSVDLGGRNHLHIPLKDVEDESLLPHLPKAICFIQEALKCEGRILMHCQAGVSRCIADIAKVPLLHLFKGDYHTPRLIIKVVKILPYKYI